MFEKSLFAALFTLTSTCCLADPGGNDVGVRNVRLVDTMHEQWISATGYNKTDRTLPVVTVTFQLLRNGQVIGTQTSEFRNIGPGDAWKIWQPVSSKRVDGLAAIDARSLGEQTASGLTASAAPQ